MRSILTGARRRVSSRLLLVVALLLSAATLRADPTFTIQTVSFDDANGNGLIDCGEQLDLRAVVFDNLAQDGVPVTGRIKIPSNFPNHFTLYSWNQDFAFSNRCLTDPASGSSNGFTLDYTCQPQAAPNNGYVLTLDIQGAYTGPTGAISFQGTDEITSPVPRTLTATYGESRTNGCPQADLQLTKSDGGITSAPGRTVPYTLTVFNRGNSAASATILSEIVPLYTRFNASASSSGWSCTPDPSPGSTCSLSLGNLVVGGSASRIFAVEIGTDVPASVSSIQNTASVSSAVAEANPADNTASDSTPITPGIPDLALQKSTTSTGASPGSTILWTLTTSNLGNASAANVTLTETLPPSTTFDGSISSPGWTCSSSSCTLSLGALAAGSSLSRQFGVRVASPVPSTLSSLTNTACAATTTPQEPTANNCGSTTTPLEAAPRLQVTKSLASGSPTPGASLTWTITVTNTGNRDAGAVTLRETVPAGTSFDASASSPGWTCSPSSAAGSACSLILPSLAGGGAAASRNFATRIANPLPAGLASIDNTACASTSGSADACGTISVPPDGSPNPTLTKRLASGNGAPGSVLVFTLTAQNSGNQDASNVTLRETIPEFTTWNRAQSDPAWNCTDTIAGSSCSLTLATLPAGNVPTTLSFAVNVVNPLPAGATAIRNTACIDPQSVGAFRRRTRKDAVCDTVTVTPAAAPILQLSKTLTTGTPAAGNTLLYSLSIANTGNQDASQVSLTDTIPAGATYSAGSDSWSCTPSSQPPSSCSHDVGPLAAGASTTVRIAFSVDSPVPPGQTSIDNTACGTDGVRRVCASTSHPLVPSGTPTLQIRKTYSGPPLHAGALLPFHLLVTNSGAATANGVRLRETVPASTTFSASDSDPSWSCSAITPGSSCTLDLGSVPAGGQRDVVFAVRAPDPLPPNVRQIANAVCLEDSAGSSLGCDQTSTPLDVAIAITLSDSLATDSNHDGHLSTGESLRYTLVIHNPTAQPASEVSITVALDPHLSLQTGSVVSSAGTITSGNLPGEMAPALVLHTLSSGETVTLTFDALAGNLQHLTEVSSQATGTGANIEDTLSDDPDTPAPLDPTRTSLAGGPVPAIPTLGQVGLALLALLLSGAALFVLRRRASAR